MARHLFGGGISDFVVSYGDGGALLLAAGQTVTFWDSRVDGSPYTDLLDLTDTPITSVTSSGTGAIPQLRGPDGVRAMWAAASADGTGDRQLMLAADLPADIATLEGRVAILEAAVDGQAASVVTLDSYAPLYVYRDPGTGEWPTRPDVGSRRVWWVDTRPDTPSPPTIGGGYMLDNSDFYVGRA